MKRKKHTLRPDSDRETILRQEISPEMQKVYSVDDAGESVDYEEDELEEDGEQRHATLRELFRSGSSVPPREIVSIPRLARGIIANQEAQFFLDSDLLPTEAVLQVRTKVDGHVGPILAGAIYSALAMSGLDVCRWRVIPFERSSGKQCFAFFVIANADGTLPSSKVVEAVLREAGTITPRSSEAWPHPNAHEPRSGREGGGRGERDVSHWERYAAIREFENDRRVVALRRKLHEISNQIALTHVVAQHASVSSHRSELSSALVSEQAEQLEQALELAIGFEREKDRLEARVRSLEGERIALNEALREYKYDREDADRIMDELSSSADLVRIDRLFPEICFIQSGAIVLSADQNATEWVRALSLMTEDWDAFRKFINARGKVLPLTEVKAGWWEVRLTRSHGDMIRLYVSKDLVGTRRDLVAQGQTWLARVHQKKNDEEQRRVISRLP